MHKVLVNRPGKKCGYQINPTCNEVDLQIDTSLLGTAGFVFHDSDTYICVKS